MRDAYIKVITIVERLHRHLLAVVKRELDDLGIHDINGVQGSMLFNIGDAEMTVGELTSRGCYLGSNVTYNLKKMVENGYISHERSAHDRRLVYVRLTRKGAELHERLLSMHQRYAQMLSQAEIIEEDLQATIVTLHRLGRFWDTGPDVSVMPVMRETFDQSND